MRYFIVIISIGFSLCAFPVIAQQTEPMSGMQYIQSRIGSDATTLAQTIDAIRSKDTEIAKLREQNSKIATDETIKKMEEAAKKQATDQASELKKRDVVEENLRQKIVSLESKLDMAQREIEASKQKQSDGKPQLPGMPLNGEAVPFSETTPKP